MNYGYYLTKEDRTDLKQVGQTLLNNGADCFLYDIDNLNSDLPKWITVLGFLKKGDKLIVSELNDIFLPLNELLKLFENFKEEGIQFLSLKENFGFNQNNHNFFSAFTIYDDYYKKYYGSFTKKKLELAKINNQPPKDRSKKTPQATPKAMKIAEKYLKGKPVEEIKDEHNVCHSTLKGYLQHVGINPAKDRNGKLPGFEDDEPVIKNIVEMYKNEPSIAKIIRNYPTLNRRIITNVLISQGVEIVGRGNWKRKSKLLNDNDIDLDIDKAIVMYKNDELVPTIVKECNFPSRSKLLQVLKECNVKIRPVGWSRANHYKKVMDVEKAISMYQNDELVPTILKECNVSSRIILLKTLKEHNIEIRTVGGYRGRNKKKAVNIKKAIKMYQNGDFVPKIIKECNFSSRNQLLSILKENNVQIRSIGWSKIKSNKKDMDVEKAISIYQDNELVPTILTKCNIPSRIKLLKILRERNIKIRSVGRTKMKRKNSQIDTKKAISMYQNGDLVPNIMKECNISNRNKLLDILKEEGVEIRRVGRPRY